MSTALKRYPKQIHYRRYARNSFVPEAAFPGRVVAAQNHIMAYRRKTFLTANDLGRGSGVAGSSDLYRFYCRTGHGATHMAFVVGLGLDNTSTGADPYVRCAVTEIGVGTTNLDLHGGAFNGTPDDSPSEISWQDGLVAVTPNALYSVVVTAVDYARLFSILAYEVASDEVDDATDYFAEFNYSGGVPIYDSLAQRTSQGLSQLWRHNAGQLLTWPGAGTGTSPTYATTTWTNVIDAATSVTASTAGFYLGDGDQTLEAWRRASDTTLDVVLAVHCSVTGSATGEVRLIDSVGTRASITGMGTGSAWYTTATTMSGLDTLGKADLQCRTSNGANTVTLNAVCLYAYLA